ncbi:MAG: hypothetical protein JXQ96_10170 [Cyclobacteriaceae bacterium]
MKIPLLLSLFLWAGHLTAQNLFFYENKVIDKAIPLSSDSYMPRFVHLSNTGIKYYEDKFHFSMRWQPISLNEIVGGNVWLVGRLNLLTNKLDTIHYDKQSNIIDITANPEFVIYLETIDEMQRFDDFELVKWNLINKTKSKIPIDRDYNIVNLQISPDSKNLAFIDAQDNIFNIYMCILDLTSLRVRRIEKGNLGGWGETIGMNWNGDNLQYCIRTEKGLEQHRYNLVSGKIVVEEVDISTFNRYWFAARYGTSTYVMHDTKIERFQNGAWSTVYETEYKYDNLGNWLYLIGK